MSVSKGSTWRKWDLHIHTPLSIYENYGGDNNDVWEKYITALEMLPEDVKVIGINDYYFIDGYEKVMQYKKLGRLNNIEKIFPILEFRIDTFGTASESKFQKINLHILINIDEENIEAEIKKIKEELIGQIHLTKLSQHSTKQLNRTNLIACSSVHSLSTGFEEIIPSTDEVLKVVNSPAWKNKVFILIGYTEWNNLEKGKQLKLFKQELYDKADAFFTASQDDSTTNKEKILHIFGDNKCLLHSLDIHDFEKLKSDKYKCYTWIKADPTFDGLKQILYEPKERVRIQENNPKISEVKSNIICKVIINNQPDWFSNSPIELNSSMVSIIGEKGSGKTALLDLIAFGSDEGIFECDEDNPQSFIKRAKSVIPNLSIDLYIEGQDEPNYSVLKKKPVKECTDKYANVRYICLKELENYCDTNSKLQEFLRQIINGDTDTNEYISRSNDFKNNLYSLNNEIMRLENENARLEESLKAISKKEQELENHIKNEPKVKTNLTPEESQNLKALLGEEQEKLLKLKNIHTAISELNEFQKWINIEVKSINEKVADSLSYQISTYRYLGNFVKDKIKFKVSVEGIENIDILINNGTKQKDSVSAEIDKIRNLIKPLQEKQNIAISEQKSINLWIEKRTSLNKEIEDLNHKKEKIEQNKVEISNKTKQRKKLYSQLLSIKVNQRKQFELLSATFEKEPNIKFDVKITFDTNGFLDIEDKIIRHDIGFSKTSTINNLKSSIVNKIVDYIETSNYEGIYDTVFQITNTAWLKENFGRDKLTLTKKSFEINEFYDWVFDDYFDVQYQIRYKGKPLEALSPGQKGLVLMKIFLRLDKSTKPLLIDQPEDNLDNKSVYIDLVNDFKDAKTRRQIIIATHNPNLVVNTDCEQVIVASFEEVSNDTTPRIQYCGGSLEDSVIRSHVCDILEGGDKAFAKREKRYNIQI